jgi:diacylglycerol kinase family enzyme
VSAGLGSAVALGLLPLGTGSDLARALGLHGDLDAAIAAIAAGATRRVDMGRVTSGGGEERLFLNVASFGISGEVVAALARRDDRGGRGRPSYAAAAVSALLRWRNPRARVSVDGRVLCDGPFVFAAAANGRYFGGGMHVAPRAELDDGLLDAVVVRGMSRAALLARFPRIYAGTHLDLPAVAWARGVVVEVETDVPLGVEADGETLFETPARAEVIPGAVGVFVREC